MTYDDRQQEKFQRIGRWKVKQLLKKVLLLAFVGFILTTGWKWTKSPPAALPGQTIPDLGRQHVPEGEIVEYNSNPPTSGPHYEAWEKAGIYDQPLTDEKLVHSLEHGYVIISYDCNVGDKLQVTSYKQNNIKNNFNIVQVFAHEIEEPHDEPATESGETTGEITEEEREGRQSVESWKDDPDCQSLVSELERIAKKMGLKKLILVPRPNLDSRIALTAWTKLDTLDEPDEDRITRFSKAYRDKGPEKTIE